MTVTRDVQGVCNGRCTRHFLFDVLDEWLRSTEMAVASGEKRALHGSFIRFLKLCMGKKGSHRKISRYLSTSLPAGFSESALQGCVAEYHARFTVDKSLGGSGPS